MKLEGDTSNPRSRAQGLFKQVPNGFGHWASMGVCVEIQQRIATSDVQFNDPGKIQVAQEGLGSETVISGVYVNVVQVQENAATGFARKTIQKLRLGHLLVGHIDVVDIVFKQERTLHNGAYVVYAFDKQIEDFLVVRHR